jgi:hypothetical protein
MRFLHIEIDPDLMKQLKDKCLSKGLKIKYVVTRLIVQYIDGKIDLGD